MYKKDGTMEVYKANKLIDATHKMNKNELKLFLLAIGNIDPYKPLTAAREIKISKSDIATQLGLKNSYDKELQKTVRGMPGKAKVTFDDGITEGTYVVVTQGIYHYKKPYVTFKLNADMMPYLTELKSDYTKYKLENVLSMNSGYAVRLYEIFKRRYYAKDPIRRADEIFNKGEMNYDELKTHATEWTVSLEELRRLTETTDKHTDWRNWNRKVLQPALSEINKGTDIRVAVIKKLYWGRSIHDLVFKIKYINDMVATVKVLETLEMQQSLFGDEISIEELDNKEEH